MNGEISKRTIAELNEQEPEFFISTAKKKSKVGNEYKPTYICPSCGNGSGKDGTGIARYKGSNGTRWHCMKCGGDWDIISLYQEAHGGEFREAVESLCEYYGITPEYDSPIGGTPSRGHALPSAARQVQEVKQEAPKPNTPQPQEADAERQQGLERNAAQIKHWQNYLTYAADFLKSRGIDYEYARAHGWGVDTDSKEATALHARMLVIPLSNSTYNRRNMNADCAKENRFRKSSYFGGFFNMHYLTAGQGAQMPIYVTEAELDAAAIEQTGAETGALAIGLNGTGAIRKFSDEFLATLKEKPRRLILCLDADSAGQEAQTELAERLDALGIPYLATRIFDGTPYKDANEFLINNRALFIQRLKSEYSFATEYAGQIYKPETAAAEAIRAELPQGDFIARRLNANDKYYSTGFDYLDALMGGGIKNGLYILGAPSSAGKTTLFMQIADNIARQGESVIIFSLEMGRDELIARSISRTAFTFETKITAAEILNSAKLAGRMQYEETQKGVTYANRKYHEYARQNIRIIEAKMALGVQAIRETTEKIYQYTRKKPVVFVDYFQILAPFDDKVASNDKMNADRNISYLRRMCRDLQIPVFVISATNRSAYYTESANEMLRESSQLEFSADCVMGLQYHGIEESGKKQEERKKFVEAQKNKQPREMDLTITKHRNGSTGRIGLKYFSAYNYFEECQYNEDGTIG